MATWESLRRQAKQLENEAEAKLAQYSKAAGSSSSESFKAGTEQSSLLPLAWTQTEQMEAEIGDVLRRLTKVTNQMADVLDNPGVSAAPTNPSMMHVLQRHREILYDYSKEFHRTKVRGFFVSYVPERVWVAARLTGCTDMMLNERGKIDGAHGIADTVLEQAQATREQLDSQGRMLAKSRGRLGGVLQRFPAINSLVNKIGGKRKRDQMIVAGVLGVCAFILMWVAFR
ncbi:Golgi SNAP receptor complex member 1-like protein [Chytriomyces sp. MP71]|nr:Golgi SNAP receptor complex member 1-like protein [Chytriomyces sp. MP71]